MKSIWVIYLLCFVVHTEETTSTCPTSNTSPQPINKSLEKELETTAQYLVSTSIVNTTDNTYKKSGKWFSNMGPLTTRRGGLACDNTVRDMKFHQGDFQHWYLAPSDSISILGMKKCAKTGRGEPSCSENWNLCGRKVRVACLASTYCGTAGEPSLVSKINNNTPPTNNYLPDYFVKELTAKYGQNPKIPKSIVLYITDFCPANHSNNIKNDQCQGPQVDLSTSAFLLMGKMNRQGYINSNTNVSMELLPENDPTPVGPEY